MVDLITKYNVMKDYLIKETILIKEISMEEQHVLKCICEKPMYECVREANFNNYGWNINYPKKIISMNGEVDYYCGSANGNHCKKYRERIDMNNNIKKIRGEILNIEVVDIKTIYLNTFRELVSELLLTPNLYNNAKEEFKEKQTEISKSGSLDEIVKDIIIKEVNKF